ncbi:hypothetical protein V2J09_015894 [Rumex salicifolius]
MRNPAADQQAGSRAPKTTPCCSKVGIKRGPWTTEEDEILSRYIKREGEGAWRTLPKRAGLLRCGKSCRLRWMNYLRPHLNRGPISPDEEDLILRLHRLLGNRWSLIAGRIPGRTDNEIKNYWNTHLSKKLISQGLDPRTHKPLEIYSPNPKNHNDDDLSYGTTTTTTNQAKDSIEPNPNPILATNTSTSMPSPPPPPPPPVTTNQEAKPCNDGMIMADYNEEMYFSSFLDSLIMNEDCVYQQSDYERQLFSNDNNNQSQDQSMMMMQPMGTYEPNQGMIWGSDHHEASTLMASGISHSQRDIGNRNLHPAEMQRKYK